ncbi:hypothetical protein HKCCE2091_15340 [Rhodobacterales bacterium HKCCE2091]|nr:hypothetical protein [Rhodobacterales bacterium HKCCE2091]
MSEGKLAYLWRTNRVALAAFAATLLLVVFFAVRFTLFAVYWSDPDHREQPIEGWMTPGYVARSWHVDTDVIRAALPPPPDETLPGRLTFARIAAENGIPLPDLIAGVEAAIADARAAAP